MQVCTHEELAVFSGEFQVVMHTVGFPADEKGFD